MVAKLDGLARSVRDTADLVERVPLIAIDLNIDTTTPVGEAMMFNLATFAQLERRLIGQRISEALQVKVSQGWKPTPHTPARAISQAARRRVVELHRRGLSERAIAERLNTDGVPAVGAAWHRNTVRRVLGQEEVTA